MWGSATEATQDRVALGELREDGEEALFDGGGVEGREQDDQGAARGRAEGGGGEAAGVRLDEFRFERWPSR